MSKRYLSAKEAAEALNISLSTLYAYVSRGLIRSEASDAGKRQRRYYSEDIQKLLARKAGRNNPEKLARDALHWGAPVMDSAITLIDKGRVYYRGHDVTQLAQTQSIEEVAALIWTGDMAHAVDLFDFELQVTAQTYEAMLLSIEVAGASIDALQELLTILPAAEADDPSAYDLRPVTVARTGARILRVLASVAAGDVPEDVSIAQMLQQGWCAADEQATSLLNAALIVIADHELNASSFTARVAASAGATIYAAVSSGLATLRGVKHGGETARVQALFGEVATAGNTKQVIGSRLQRGEHIPGFGQRLYPDGDPRATLLLSLLQEHYGDHPATQRALAISAAVQSLIGEAPNVDFTLVAVAMALDLPPNSALTLFALGRTVGWVGHAIEQYEQDRLIRPRARYVGVLPSAQE